MQVVMRRSRKGKPFLITSFEHFMEVVTSADTVIPSTQAEVDLINGYALVAGKDLHTSLKVPNVKDSHVHVTINIGRQL